VESRMELERKLGWKMGLGCFRGCGWGSSEGRWEGLLDVAG
jgi:hypothetical protein